MATDEPRTNPRDEPVDEPADDPDDDRFDDGRQESGPDPKPDSDALLALLDRAFDGWGSRAYFEWKYDDFPGYDPATDNFLVYDESGDPIAARRIFRRRLETPDGDATVHVHGGTVVDQDHRGRGHYTTLLERSMAYSREHADHVVTFNRAGKITTEHHRDDGWQELTLPVYSKVLSPSRVFAHYLADADVAGRLARYTARVDRRATRSTLVSRLLSRMAGAVYGDPDRATRVPPRDTRQSFDVDVVDGAHLGDELVQRLADHLDAVTDEPYHFERRPRTIRHAGRYPGATVYVARESSGADPGEPVAFVISGMLEKDGLTECRIVEQSWAEPAATRRLFERVEADARAAGADVLVGCSDRRPGPDWIPLATEYMMWPPTVGDRTLPTSEDAWRIATYDVL